MSAAQSAKIGKPADPKDIVGEKKLVWRMGYMTEMGVGHPARIAPPMGHDKQIFDIKHNEKDDTYCIMLKGEDVGLHYPSVLFPNALVTFEPSASAWKICYAESENCYIICPAGREHQENIEEPVLGPASALVYPPMAAIQPRRAGDFHWELQRA